MAAYMQRLAKSNSLLATFHRQIWKASASTPLNEYKTPGFQNSKRYFNLEKPERNLSSANEKLIRTQATALVAKLVSKNPEVLGGDSVSFSNKQPMKKLKRAYNLILAYLLSIRHEKLWQMVLNINSLLSTIYHGTSEAFKSVSELVAEEDCEGLKPLVSKELYDQLPDKLRLLTEEEKEGLKISFIDVSPYIMHCQLLTSAGEPFTYFEEASGLLSLTWKTLTLSRAAVQRVERAEVVLRLYCLWGTESRLRPGVEGGGDDDFYIRLDRQEFQSPTSNVFKFNRSFPVDQRVEDYIAICTVKYRLDLEGGDGWTITSLRYGLQQELLACPDLDQET